MDGDGRGVPLLHARRIPGCTRWLESLEDGESRGRLCGFDRHQSAALSPSHAEHLCRHRRLPTATIPASRRLADRETKRRTGPERPLLRPGVGSRGVPAGLGRAPPGHTRAPGAFGRIRGLHQHLRPGSHYEHLARLADALDLSLDLLPQHDPGTPERAFSVHQRGAGGAGIPNGLLQLR